MRPAEILSGMEGGEIKQNDGGVKSSMIYLTTFVNATMYPQHNKKNKI
jgi:hypothetical protein